MFSGCSLAPFEKNIYLASPKMHRMERRFVEEAFDTNWMSTVGKNIDEIERLVAERLDVKYAIALSSGTAALHLAMRALGIAKGTKVFCPDLTFIATVSPVVYQSGIPILIDSETSTWNIDPVALEKAFERHPEVKHVVIVNLFGTPCLYDEIRAVCDKYNAVVIEDAAESFGALYGTKSTGNLGEVGVISFNGNKIITGTCGGMLLTNSLKVAEKVRKWSTQSREIAPWYQHKEIGYNYRMSNLVAGVARGQMSSLDEHIAAKKDIYERYKSGFSDLPVRMNPFNYEDSKPNFWLSCITVDNDAMCEQHRNNSDAIYKKENGKSCPTEILETLKAFNVEGRPLWKPMHLQPLFDQYEFVSAGKCVSEDLFNRGLCLPSDINMTAQQQDKIIEIIKCCFN